MRRGESSGLPDAAAERRGWSSQRSRRAPTSSTTAPPRRPPSPTRPVAPRLTWCGMDACDSRVKAAAYRARRRAPARQSTVE
ncbi:hypothetical protein FCN18_05675 [Prauserella endophytica]|uniref:Zinc finger CGNR domain-containing protein n=1 Tax=Prauserella endophytica TaxID=1592324 RepID=A0ABY2SAM0_9PSEU|nr:hypothetical protein FCN18_05675 [Prauserella endophytica]